MTYSVAEWAMRPGPWEVRVAAQPLDSWVNNVKRIASVPDGTDRITRAIRIHEATHAVLGQTKETDAIEYMGQEIRTNAIAWHAGADIGCCHDSIDFSDKPAATSRRQAATQWLQTASTACSLDGWLHGEALLRADVSPTLATYWLERDNEFTDYERAELRAAVTAIVRDPRTAVVEEVAARLNKTFALPTPDATNPAPQEQFSCAPPGSLSAPEPAPTPDAPEATAPAPTTAFQRLLTKHPVATDALASPRPHRSSRAKIEALLDNRLAVVDLVPTGRSTARVVRRPGGTATRGDEIVHWDRMAGDRQVFAARERGGTLLIDASGSMRWTDETLRALVRDYPAVTIAMYSGSGAQGTLNILARNGRLADIPESMTAGGNVVDLEALDWLSRQSAPRIWLSDGAVCGGAMATHPTATAQAIADIAHGARVVRADTTAAAVAAIRGTGWREKARLHTPRDADFIKARAPIPREARDSLNRQRKDKLARSMTVAMAGMSGAAIAMGAVGGVVGFVGMGAMSVGGNPMPDVLPILTRVQAVNVYRQSAAQRSSAPSADVHGI